MRNQAQNEESNARRRMRRALLKRINEIVDPCSIVSGAPAGLVDFGLIRGIDLNRGGGGKWNVRVRLTLTEPGCIMGGPFAMRIRDKLVHLPGIASVDVRIEAGELWTEASMSKGYATQLAAARAERIAPVAFLHAKAP